MKIFLPLLILLPSILCAQKKKSDPCKDIETSLDKFTGETWVKTPPGGGLNLVKLKKDSTETYYLKLGASGSTIKLRAKGVIILFADGTRLEWPNEDIDVKVSRFGSGYTYQCFINLKANELDKLKTTPMTDFRLYVYDAEVKKDRAQEFMSWINCPAFN